jgi:glycosyltransferase involved in cell wall biosynthesis
MKILHVVQGYPPAIGGTEEAFGHLSEQLVRNFGDEVTVFTTNCFGGDAFNRFGLPLMKAGTEDINGVKVMRFRVMRWLSWFSKIPQYVTYKMKCRCSQYLRTLYQGPVIAGLGQAIRRSDADLVVASSFPLLHMYTALKAAKIADKPIILVGGLHPEDAWSFDRHMIAKALKAADACIAYTGYEAGQILKMGVAEENIYTIGLGVDLQTNNPETQTDIRDHLGLKDGPVVGYIGQISAHKGVDLLFKSMQRVWVHHPEAQLLIAGARRPFAEKVEEMILALPEWQKNNIIIRYDFPDNEKASLYQVLDIFVYPSRYESFGIAFLEAWNAHKPVIGLKVGAIPWVVEDGVNGLLVDGDDIGGLASAINRLIEDPKLAQRLAENGNQKVVSQYTWSAIASQFHAVYEEVIKQKREAWRA